jgi:serine/threonine protein kinase
MGDQGFDRYVAPWERLRAGFDPEADKPTLVQAPEELLATERAPRTLPARRVNESLLELEGHLDDAASSVGAGFDCVADTRFDARGSGGAALERDGMFTGDAAQSPRPEGELEAAYDDAWSPNARSDEPSHIGQVIDNRYVVEALIARGGMGIVYRCRHKLIDRRFAVKIIRSTMAHLPDAPRRFLMEAKAASAIGNEHIIDVVDYGSLADGSAYLVMELLEGLPLSDVIAKHETLPVGRITAIAAQMCEGLRAAHDAGIVHRDLKPENVFLTNRKLADFVKILDFGIAKMARSGEPLTKKGLIVGTPHYMSPEQAAGAPVDARGDIYSLGVILYELATGRVPFDAAHYMAVLAKHMTEPPPPFDTLSLQTKLPREFEVIVQRCLAKRPEQRYQTMTDVLGELERLSLSLRSPSRPSIETMLPLAPLVPFEEEAARNTGNSVPAAPGRSVMAQPKRRSFALFFSALGLATLTGVSLLRMQGPEEQQGAGGARSARGPAMPASEPGAAAAVDTLQAPLATATASLASTPGPAIGPPPPAPAPASDTTSPTLPATSSTTEAAIAPADGEIEDTGQITTMEPLTVVELAPGKSVEIEARTRLSLRLTKEGHSVEPGAQRSSARKGAKGKGSAGANGASERDGAGKASASNAGGEKAPPGKAGSSKGGSGKGGSGKGGAGKRERAVEARAPSELMNPWPSPVIGPAKE